MAPRRRKVPFLVRFRNLLLVALLLLVAAVVGLFLFGRSGLEPAEPATGGARSDAPAQGVTSRSEGFDYTQYEEGRPLFRVRGATQSLDREEAARLEDVRIQLFRPDGQTFEAESERALYQRKVSAAELEGDVRLAGPNGLKLWTEKLVVGQQGSRVTSPVPVRFEYGPRLSGRSNSLRMELPARIFILQGGVVLEGRQDGESGRLVADRGYFEEERRLLRADGDVRLTHGGDYLEAQRLSAYLDEGEDVLRFVRAKWKVGGRMTIPAAAGSAAPEEPIAFAAEAASLLLDPSGQQVRKVELEGSDRQAAFLETLDRPTGRLRRLTSNYVVGDFAADTLGTVQAFGQVRLAELAPAPAGSEPRTLREARAERAEATLDARGSLELATLTGSVDYREPAFQVTSDRGRINFREGLAQFLGEEAKLVGEDGTVTARQLVFNRERNLVIASGDSRTALTRGDAVPGPMLASGEGPVFVEAEEARWNRDLDRTVFSGGVRAWRGRDLLLAEEMAVERRSRRLEAGGSVRTIWHPQRAGGAAAARSLPARREDGGLQSDTLEVSADRFAYLGDEDRLRYEGKVVIVDGTRTMRCGRTEIFLDEQDRMRRLECLQQAHLEETAQGRVIDGERAIYDPAAGEIRIWGSPVSLKDRQGNRLQGELLVYRLADETMQFSAAPAGAPNGTE